MIDGRGDVVAIGAGTDEERTIRTGAVLCGHRPHTRFDEELGRMRRQVYWLGQQGFTRHGAEQLLGGLRADHGEHVRALGGGMGKVTHRNPQAVCLA
jgi:hypothetical protein